MNRTPSLSRRARRRAGRRRSGFTLIEVLVAMALLGLIIVGVLPLFTQSMMNNVKGSQATQATTYVGETLDDASQERFQSADISWATADTQIVRPLEYLVEDPNPTQLEPPKWVAAIPAGKTEAWRRAVTLQEYSVGDLYDNGELDTALAGTTDPIYVHLKQVEVVVRAGGSFRPPYTVRMLKTF